MTGYNELEDGSRNVTQFYRDAIGGTDDLPRTSGYRNVRIKFESLHFWQSVASVLHTLLLGTIMASTCIYTYLIQGDLVARNALRKHASVTLYIESYSLFLRLDLGHRPLLL